MEQRIELQRTARPDERGPKGATNPTAPANAAHAAQLAHAAADGSRVGHSLAGKYRLEERLGSGGMGDVYRARNTLINRVVAIKLLRPEHANNTEVTARFLREARAANLVRHPNVVDVLDVGQDTDGTPYIVQELLEGEDLATRLRREGGRLPWKTALELLLPVVEAIGAAHAAGVVHRDLKPGNVFLSTAGGCCVPKLLDFGISHISGIGGDRLTVVGMAMGTPAYMAPEQVTAATTVGPRADVWALGVILYRVLSGSLPFDAEPHSALFVRIATADPTSLRELVPDVPATIVGVVERCLKKAPRDRFADGNELARALRAAATGTAPARMCTVPTVAVALPIPSLVPVAPLPKPAVVARDPLSLVTVPPAPKSTELRPSSRPRRSLFPRPSLAPLRARASRVRARSERPAGPAAVASLVPGADGATVSGAHVARVALLLVAVIAVERVLAIANPLEDGIRAASFWLDLFWTLPVWVGRAVLVALVAVGALVVVRTLEARPARTHLGQLVVGSAFVALAVVTGFCDVRGVPLAARGGADTIVSLILASLPFGVALDAFRDAVARLRGRAPDLLARATKAALFTGVTLFVVFQILRGAG